MIPILLGLGAAGAALFLSGCSGKGRDEKSESPPPKSSASAFPSALPPEKEAPKPPAPPPEYTAVFGTDLNTGVAYRRLLEAGVKPDAIDQGCLISKKTYGKSDLRIEACEVQEFVLSNFDAYPEEAVRIAGQDLPWIIKGKKTKENEKVFEKIDRAIEQVAKSKTLQGIPKQWDPYRERLALSLFFFTRFPEKIPSDPAAREALKKESQELVKLDMGDFQDYLLENGGLGVSEFPPAPNGGPYEPALTALKNKANSDFSKTNILYGVLHYAGLKPQFYTSDMQYSPPGKEFTLHRGELDIFRDFFPGVLLKTPISQWHLNPETGEVKSADPQPDLLSNRRYLALYFFGRGADYFIRNGKSAEGIPLLLKDLDLHPEHSRAYVPLGIGYKNQGRYDLAKDYFKEAIRIDPKQIFAHWHLADLYFLTQDTENGLKHYLEAYQSPLWRTEYDDRSLSKKMEAYAKKNPAHPTVVEIMKLQKKRAEEAKKNSVIDF